MKKLDLVSKFSLISFVTLVFTGFAFGWIIFAALESQVITRAVDLTGNFIRLEMGYDLVNFDLSSPKSGKEYNLIAETIQDHMSWIDVVQIKIWNSDSVVVWSYDESIIGKRFPDNDNLAKALQGRTVSKPTSKKVKEKGSERIYDKLLTLYVPLDVDNNGEVENVFEIYQNFDQLYIDLARQKKILWIAVIGSFSVLYLLLISTVKGASSLITSQAEKIITSERQYRNLVKSAPEAIISIDKEGKIVLFNEAAEQTFGYSEKQVVGKSVTVLIPEEYREKHNAGLSRFLATGESKILGTTVEVEALKKAGEKFPVKLSLSAINTDSTVTITGILRDISDRKAMEQQLIESEKQASVAIIASSIGHELSNALGGLLGYAQMLKEKSDDTEYVKKCSEIFSTQSERLGLHAKNLLSLGKPNKPILRPIFVNAFLDDVTEMLIVSGVLKTFTIEKYYDEDLPAIQVDPELMEQVVRNLEINAAHAMDSLGILTLTTKLLDKGSHLEFSVGDTGHGFAADRRHQIFLPFYTTKEEGKGTGLGMYIIKQVVEQHNGYIRIDSKEGVGTTVTVGLPV